MLIRDIEIRNLLSFGDVATKFTFRPLNVLIGPNGSGKSNLIDVIDLLRSSAQDMTSVVQASGGPEAWWWRGAEGDVARVAAQIDGLQLFGCVTHSLEWDTGDRDFFLDREVVFNKSQPTNDPNFWVETDRAHSSLKIRGQVVPEEDMANYDWGASALSQLKDPVHLRLPSLLAHWYQRIRIYRNWSFGREAPIRRPEQIGNRQEDLGEDLGNLASLLHRIGDDAVYKQRILKELNALYPDIKDVDGRLTEGAFLIVRVEEPRGWVSGPRLSDGTLRYLCLLVILLNPSPPPLICIEEPELGLHPDVIVKLADLLKEASQRTQLIITTHSPMLVDCFSDSPEDIVVCEKDETGSTTFRRLEPEKLGVWLEKYSLGDLWSSGQIGGNRW